MRANSRLYRRRRRRDSMKQFFIANSLDDSSSRGCFIYLSTLSLAALSREQTARLYDVVLFSRTE